LIQAELLLNVRCPR